MLVCVSLCHRVCVECGRCSVVLCAGVSLCVRVQLRPIACRCVFALSRCGRPRQNACVNHAPVLWLVPKVSIRILSIKTEGQSPPAPPVLDLSRVLRTVAQSKVYTRPIAQSTYTRAERNVQRPSPALAFVCIDLPDSIPVHPGHPICAPSFL